MNALALLSGLVKLIQILGKWMSDRQLIKAGEYRALSQGMIRSRNAIQEAIDARNLLDSDPSFRERLRKRYRADK